MSQRHASIAATVSHDLHSGANTRIPARWLLLARVALLAISVLALILYVVGTPVYFAQLLPSHHCFQDCPTPTIVHSLHALGITITTYAAYMTMLNVLFALVYFAVAALIFWRKSADWMALLASLALVTFGSSFPSIPGTLAVVHPAWSLPVTLVGSEHLLAVVQETMQPIHVSLWLRKPDQSRERDTQLLPRIDEEESVNQRRKP